MFEIVDPASFDVIARGTTSPATRMPEPATWTLLLLAGIAAWCARHGRRLLGIAGIGAALALTGCGGGSKGDGQLQGESARMRALAVGSVGEGSVANVGVDALVLVAERRISRTVYQYDYRLRLAGATRTHWCGTAE